MPSWRHSLLPAAAVVLRGSSAGAEEVHIRSQKGLTDGALVVRGQPRDLYAALTDYGRWPQIFPEVASARIAGGSADSPVVEVRDQGGQSHVLRFQNDPRRLTIRFREHANRVRVSVVLVLSGTARPGWSRVSARLRAEVTGPARLFAGEGRVRKKREDRLRRDLGHVRDYAHRVVASAQ